jgi:Fur family transcriptional regulator, ferric uptake regulator
VLAALVEAGGFCSAQDIYMRLRAGGRSIGLSTVYRHLQSLAEQGEADVIRTSDGEATYRYCQTRGVHHHHLVCRRCGRAEEIEDRPVERWASAVAEKFGYTAIDHIVEVFGTCGDCSA